MKVYYALVLLLVTKLSSCYKTEAAHNDGLLAPDTNRPEGVDVVEKETVTKNIENVDLEKSPSHVRIKRQYYDYYDYPRAYPIPIVVGLGGFGYGRGYGYGGRGYGYGGRGYGYGGRGFGGRGFGGRGFGGRGFGGRGGIGGGRGRG